MKAYFFDGEKGINVLEKEIPAELLEDARKYRAELVEKVAEYDDSTMQMYKKYRVTDAATGEWREYHRKVVKPQPVAPFLPVTIYQDGLVMGSQPAVDSTTGTVAVDPADGHIYSWTGCFDVPVRFDVDGPSLVYDDFNIVSWRGITIVELLPQDLT